MVLVQPDFAGKVCCLEGEDAREEFQRIFGFPAEYIIASAMRVFARFMRQITFILKQVLRGPVFIMHL